jgi:hypothetical protein
MKKILLPFLLCGGSVLVSMGVESCYYDKEADLYPTTTTATCDTTNAKFAAFVTPLMVNSCAYSGCHSAASQASGINLGNYAAIKAYITANKGVYLGSIDRTAGYSAMPKGSGKLAACDITKLKNWINAGMLNN